MGRLHVGVEGLYQTVGRIALDAAGNSSNATATVWGAAGGARVEVGPVRLGASAFHGQGIGLGFVGQRSAAISDDDNTFGAAAGGLTYKLRTFTGYYGQAAVVSGRWQVGAGYGQGFVDQLDVDKRNPFMSVIHTQTGISASVYYHLSDNVVFDVDYFHFRASWYGAPIVDTMGNPTGGKLAGELQTLDFVNAGVTYHW
jgi:hypothetical protein